MLKTHVYWLVPWYVSMFAAPLLAGAAEASPRPEFVADVQPIFVKRCSECHGPDQQKSKLRLDQRDAAWRGGKSGAPAIVPGRSADSEIIKRVTSKDPDEMMPPKGDPLTAGQIAILKNWIDQGAVWPETDSARHWSFVPPQRLAPPPSKNHAWARNEIDRFIAARLEREQLSPSPEADRATLIRRVTLDLTGLPPAPEEVERFVRDSSDTAYERLVDRLLDSPHYGEHIARWWLDLARYADSNGYQVDSMRTAWPYRDWVIRAFNENRPFDQFTLEQLAGDLLPNATLAQRVATGFHRNTKINDEGGGDAEEYRTKAVKDRVATTATTWLGLTMMCAECHTHKYDPISHEEYYRFYAFFNNTADGGNYSVEPTVPVPPPVLTKSVNYIHASLTRLERELAAAEASLPREQRAWEERRAGKSKIWTRLNLTNATSVGGATLKYLPDQSLLSTELNPIYDTVTVDADPALESVTAILLEALTDSSLPQNGPGRWGKTGNFILDEFGVTAFAEGAPARTGATLPLTNAVADWEQEYYRAEHAIDTNPKTGWAIAPQFGKTHFLIARLKEPARFAPGTKLQFRFEHYHGNSHTIGRLRLSVTADPDPVAHWPIPAEIQGIIDTAPAARTETDARQLAAFYRGISPTIRRIERDLFRLNQREAELAATKYSALVMQERSDVRDTYIHLRGNFLDKGPGVTPNVPAFLTPLSQTDGPTNRLALARWLVDPANPLTARTTVNRLWERFFGTGIVKTSEDLGRQGEPPSHLELLDWLATEFIRLDWDVKALQKLLVLSSTYRQSSAASDALLEKDYYNRLLARGPRFRLDAEVIRDQALALSGLLQSDVGGPSVFPVQPANLWKEIGFLRPEIGMDEWPISIGPDLYRRGVYTFWRRVCTYPTFAVFDAPSRDVCTSRRLRSNTPLQAMAGLNDPMLLEAARSFAQRIMLDAAPTSRAKVERAFQLCTARLPSSAERQRLLEFFELQLASFKNDRAGAERLLGAGSTECPPTLDRAELAAWMMLANLLFNLDETLTKG